MDRSSLRRVETTSDNDKRLAFKAKLAKKIDSIQEPVEQAPVSGLPGLAIGQHVIHPSLGEGTIDAIDQKNNELVLAFIDRESVSLVLSQVKSILAPIETLSVVVDDCFLGETIDRDLQPNRPDTVEKQKRLSFQETPVPVQQVTPISGIPVGSSVWHPDLGACTVFSVNEKSNSIVLEFPTGKMDFVLNQVRSKLALVSNDAPVHVGPRPTAPVAKDPVSPVTQGLSVSLPSVFPTWTPLKQYGYLTAERHLTSEQANDVIDILNGKPHRSKNTSYSLTWDDSVDDAKRFAAEQHLAERKATVQPSIEPVAPIGLPQPVLKITKLSVTLPSVFKGLQPSDQYVFLTKTKRLTPEEANDILAVYTGSNPLMVETSFEILWDDDLGKTSAGVHRVSVEPVTVVSEKPLPKTLAIELPFVFKTWRPFEQFTYLTTTKHLASEVASNVIAAADGALGFNVDITWVNDVLDKGKRLGYKEALLKRVEESVVEVELDARTPIPTDPQPVLRTIKLSVTLPSVFHGMRLSDQYSFLVNTKRLTSAEANDILAVYAQSTPRANGVEFEILWDDELGKTDAGVHRETETLVAVVEEPVLQILSIELPVIFKTWRPLEQFTYLTTTKHLTTARANSVIAAAGGAPGVNITWDNGILDRDKRLAYKESLLQKVEDASIEPEIIIPQPVPVSLSAAGVSRIMEDVIKKETVSVSKLSVVLPTSFQTWSAADQYIFLSKTKRLTPDESNNVIDLHKGGTNSNIELYWEEVAPEYFSDSGVTRWTDEVVTTASLPVLKKLSVVLPPTFRDWDSSYQHSFLVQTKKLSREEAQDVLAVNAGKTPHNNKVQYSIIWSE